MPRQWDELSDQEKVALRNLAERGSQAVESRFLKALTNHGFVEPRPEGWAISAAGRRIYDEWIITELNARRARERQLRGR